MWWCQILVPLVIAGLFVFVPWTAAFPIALALGIGTAVIAYYSARALRQPPVTGKEAMVGMAGEAVSDLNPGAWSGLEASCGWRRRLSPSREGPVSRSWRSRAPR